MDIAALTAFTEIVATGSFSQAAEKLHLTQPAISKRIAKLEQELGTPLLDRIGRHIKPTEAGAELLEKYPARYRATYISLPVIILVYIAYRRY